MTFVTQAVRRLDPLTDMTRGINYHRTLDMPLEMAFSDAWALQGDAILTAILSTPGTPRQMPSERDGAVAATVIQWIGSPVGQAFAFGVMEGRSPNLSRLLQAAARHCIIDSAGSPANRMEEVFPEPHYRKLVPHQTHDDGDAKGAPQTKPKVELVWRPTTANKTEMAIAFRAKARSLEQTAGLLAEGASALGSHMTIPAAALRGEDARLRDLAGKWMATAVRVEAMPDPAFCAFRDGIRAYMSNLTEHAIPAEFSRAVDTHEAWMLGWQTMWQLGTPI